MGCAGLNSDQTKTCLWHRQRLEPDNNFRIPVMDRNRLDGETSPYLLQHKDNPVHWQPWDQSALDEARARDRPILLSVGYAACHWCHVMAHESFEDVSTAALMNELFVNIKVDREERPDLDVIYQSALAILGEHGGWPLTMFLTPSGEPFWGGTYFPPAPRYGRPGFKDVLRRVADAYRNKRDAVAQSVTALSGAMKHLSELPKGGALVSDIADRVAERLVQDVDMELGGFGSAPKFPQPGIFELLWRAHCRTGIQQYQDAVTITLDRMCQGVFTTILAADLRAIPWMRNGWCRISKRCCTTTHS